MKLYGLEKNAFIQLSVSFFFVINSRVAFSFSTFKLFKDKKKRCPESKRSMLVNRKSFYESAKAVESSLGCDLESKFSTWCLLRSNAENIEGTLAYWLQIEIPNKKLFFYLDWNAALIIILNGTKPEHLDMLDGGIIERLLEEKWKTFAQQQFLKRLFILFIHLFFMSISVYTRPRRFKSLANVDESGDSELVSEALVMEEGLDAQTIIRYCCECATVSGDKNVHRRLKQMYRFRSPASLVL